MTSHSTLRAALLTVLLALSAASAATAQTSVRVTADHVTVWKSGFSTVATVVNTGTVLEVVARQGNWYEVVIPGPPWQPRQTGFISVTRVEAVEGGSTAPQRTAPSPTPTPTRSASSASASAASRRATIQGFGEFGYGWFDASRSFEAVLGHSGGPWFGGGVRYESGTGYFVEGSVERFQGTGERVFVVDDEVFPLGIANTLSITPLMAAGGFAFRARRFTSYVGGGVGAYFLRESSDFADDSDNVSQTNAAYRVLGGVQWPIAKHYSVGVELQYTTVPDALSGGVAAAFDERNLGGLQLNARFGFGR
jgi:opacity protein-like surface antigen